MLALSDGVFAIAITLLVLPLTELDLDPAHLRAQLVAAAPRMLVFVVGFAVIGLYWLAHHTWFSRVVAVDDGLLRTNLVLLGCVVFLPFPTAVLGRHSGSVGTVFYAGAVAVTGLAFLGTWTYLLRHPHLLRTGSEPALRRHRLSGLVPPVVFAASIPLALVAPDGGKLLWLLVWPASTYLPRAVEAARRRRHGVSTA